MVDLDQFAGLLGLEAVAPAFGVGVFEIALAFWLKTSDTRDRSGWKVFQAQAFCEDVSRGGFAPGEVRLLSFEKIKDSFSASIGMLLAQVPDQPFLLRVELTGSCALGFSALGLECLWGLFPAGIYSSGNRCRVKCQSPQVPGLAAALRLQLLEQSGFIKALGCSFRQGFSQFAVVMPDAW